MDDAAATVWPATLSHVVIITSEMAGRVNVACELVRRIRNAGHEATVASPADVGERVRTNGLDYVMLGPETQPLADSDELDGHPSVAASRPIEFVKRLRHIPNIRRRRDVKIDELDPEGFLSKLDNLSPDLVLVDVELAMHVMATAGAGIPLMTWTTMMSLRKRPGLPPLGSSIVVGSGWQGTRLGIEWAWLRFRLWKLGRSVRLRVTRFGEDQLTVLAGVADRVGFDYRRGTSRRHWLVPFVYTELPLLVCNAWPLEFPHHPHPTERYVGPVLDSARRARSGHQQAETTERLETLYMRRRSGESAALIYCSFGAWHKGDDGSFLRKIFDAVRHHPEWDVVIGLGGRMTPDVLGDRPDNVHCFEWAPQLEVLEHADVVIHHAGISSVNESVVNAVPMVLYPFDFLDQPGNAARIAYHGLGIVGHRRHDTPEQIRSNIETVLVDTRYRTNVTAMRAAFADAMDGDPAAAAILDELERS